MRKHLFVGLAALLSVTGALGFASAPDEPAHLAQARALVPELRGSSLNVYGGGKREIQWEERPVQARTVCSSFATLLLEHAYGWDGTFFKKWMGGTNPQAEEYHDAIAAHNGFLQIVHGAAIKPGDFIAIKYSDHHVSRNGVEDTGHVMLVDEVDANTPAKPPLVPGTRQVFVTVIDSSASGHGTSDSRHLGPNHFTGGIGRGVFRIYVGEDDKFAGYTWSDEKKSEYFTPPARDLVVGRLDEKRMPKG